MKKTLFVFALVLAFAIIYGYSQSRQTEMAENDAKQIIPVDLKGNSNPESGVSKIQREYLIPANTTGSGTSILLILYNEKNKTPGSKSFLWNLLNDNSGQTGC